MPQSDKREDDQEVCNDTNLTLSLSAKRNINVAQKPTIKAAMPGTPKGGGRIVVAHASDHVLRRIDAVKKTPKTEETPGNEQLQPDMMKVKVSKHAQLHRTILAPVGVRVADCDGVKEVLHHFHCQKTDEEAQGVQESPLEVDRSQRMTRLRDVVVECQDWAGKVERGVECVCQIIAESIVSWFGRDGNTIPF